MVSFKAFALLSVISSLAVAVPVRREVPQEHSHEPILTKVRQSLNLNNPDKIQDPVFALLGDAAAKVGAGDITDLACLQQAVADQAFTNAKAAGDLDGMVNALIFRAIERNTGGVGVKSALCTQTAKNPEVAALTQHQDPASDGAAATNKAITLELAKQIAAIGGQPARRDQVGHNLLVPDATDDEINAAVAGISSSGSSTDDDADCSETTVTLTQTVTSTAAASVATGGSSNDDADCDEQTVTVTLTQTVAATATASSDDDTATCAPASTVTVTITPAPTARR
ncbi:hypothetical protein ONZ51_g12545 [Trametes cubensis]|uniref:Uncharacterized protein n=1 Tax=Trametes cubensis TaxID=1111947 RepID=A0AAD7TFL8_9APHY|nr:hypothetical protein ONZ51_g12545 [Trametes cubensis]